MHLTNKKISGLRNQSQETSKRRIYPARIMALTQKVLCLKITFYKNGLFPLAHKNIFCIDVLWITNNKNNYPKTQHKVLFD